MAKGIDSGRHRMSTLPYKKYKTFVSLHIILILLHITKVYLSIYLLSVMPYMSTLVHPTSLKIYTVSTLICSKYR